MSGIARLTALTALFALTAACGSTVQIAGSGGTGSDGLSAVPSTATSAAPDGGAGAGPSGTLPLPGLDGSSAGGTGTGPADPSAVVVPTTAAGTRSQPITVGFLRATDQAALAASFGVEASGALSDEDIQRALVAWFNAHGGLRGHQLHAVFADVSSTSTDYEGQYQAACETFVHDNHVSVVVNALAYFSPTFEGCLRQARTPELRVTTTFPGSDSVTSYPYLVGVTGLSVDRRLRALVEMLNADGYLTPKSKIGVLMSGCPHNLAAYDRTFLPTLRAHGMSVTDKEVGGCTTGTHQAGQSAANATGYVLKFKGLGIDRVLIISDQEDAGLLLFTEEAESQGYRPGYAITSIASPAVLAPKIPAAQAKNLTGVGWLPFTDVDARYRPAPPSSFGRCTTLLKAEGLVAANDIDRSKMASSCSALFLLEQLAADPSVSTAQLMSRLGALGSAFDAPAVLGGRTHFSSTRRDAPAQVAVMTYDERCTCMHYLGRPRPVND